MANKSMLGKWDEWYRKVGVAGPFRYGDTITYSLAGEFMKDMTEVEDWGCGTGGFRPFFKGKYIGVDGSANPFVDKIADLRDYRSRVEGIVMRHVLEHNYDWERVLRNALESFQNKLCIIIFTPFVERTGEIAHNQKFGVDVPDIAFNKGQIEGALYGLRWRMESHQTKTHYGVEHIYYIEKPHSNICVVSANLGGFDGIQKHLDQSIACDFYTFTDENFRPRFKAMTPRLQAKIPKCFGWQILPGYEYYLWLDGHGVLTNPDSVKLFYDQCQDYDVVVIKHRTHHTIADEYRYTRKGIKQKAEYIVPRYENEHMRELVTEILGDPEYLDDCLVLGGMFMYRNTPRVHYMLKHWWYYVTRYAVQDQLSFIYVLKKSGLRLKIIPNPIESKILPFVSFGQHSIRN
jgi:hypothetical protein